jgi:hypothetical protein
MIAMKKCDTACNLLCHIELVLRKQNLPFPFYRWLGVEDMKYLWHNLAQKVPSLKVNFMYYNF